MDRLKRPRIHYHIVNELGYKQKNLKGLKLSDIEKRIHQIAIYNCDGP